ncbi:4887_t:CDS:2, partial [Diversispora eburnea]
KLEELMNDREVNSSNSSPTHNFNFHETPDHPEAYFTSRILEFPHLKEFEFKEVDLQSQERLHIDDFRTSDFRTSDFRTYDHKTEVDSGFKDVDLQSQEQLHTEYNTKQYQLSLEDLPLDDEVIPYAVGF